jgi:NADH dehydrogenase
MKVLVTGGTGFVGREVVRQLREAGHEVRLLPRAANAVGPPSRLVEAPASGTPAGTVAGGDACATSMAVCDAVIHLVGIISEAGSQTFENVHTRLTETMVRAAKQAGVRRFVHMSALGTRANAVARYHQTKWAAEEIVRASGLDWTIFRPSIIYGPDDGFVNLFARVARFSPVVPLVGGGHSKFQLISVNNVARCFVAALMEPQAIGRTFDLCGDEVLTLRQIVDAVLAATVRRRWKLPLPFGVANFQAAAAEILFTKLLGRPPPLNRDQLLMLREDNVGDGRDANALFGPKHETLAAGIGRYLKRGS